MAINPIDAEGLRVLLIGAKGFIGTHFRKKALDLGVPILSIVRETSFASSENEFSMDNPENLKRKVEAFGPNVVLDLATKFSLNPSISQYQSFVASNLTVHLQIFRVLQDFQLPWLYTGSYWQRRSNQDGSPISDYHLKKTVWDFLESNEGNARLQLTLMDTYGPNDGRDKIVNKLVKYGNNDKILELSPGFQLVNLLYIDDVINGLFQGCMYLQSSQNLKSSFDLINPKFVTLRELVATVEKVRGVELPIAWGARAYRPGEIFQTPEDLNPFPKYRNFTSLESGLREMLEIN